MTYCECETPVMDVEHDAGCRRCGLPVDFSPKIEIGTRVRVNRNYLGDVHALLRDESLEEEKFKEILLMCAHAVGKEGQVIYIHEDFCDIRTDEPIRGLDSRYNDGHYLEGFNRDWFEVIE